MTSNTAEAVESRAHSWATRSEPYRYSPSVLRGLYTTLVRVETLQKQLFDTALHRRVRRMLEPQAEVLSVGAVSALRSDDLVVTQRGALGIFVARGAALDKLLLQLEGARGGCSGGRSFGMHLWLQADRVLGLPAAAQPGIASGMALAEKMRGADCVTVVVAAAESSDAPLREAFELAARWSLPIIFLTERRTADLPESGREPRLIDGGDVLEVFEAVETAAAAIRRRPRPIVIEYRLAAARAAAGMNCATAFEQALLLRGILSAEEIRSVRRAAQERAAHTLESAAAPTRTTAATGREREAVYAPYRMEALAPSAGVRTKKKFGAAIADALAQAGDSFDHLVLVERAPAGTLPRRGAKKAGSEGAAIAAGAGLALMGMKSIVELAGSDCLGNAFDPIVRGAAEAQYRLGASADMVIRVPLEGGAHPGEGSAPGTETWTAQIPGVKVVYPSTVYDAKGLMLAAIEDPSPVLFFEHTRLAGLEEYIPDDYYNVAIGSARLVREGADVSIITYGLGVHWALEVMQRNDIEGDLLDLRTLRPLDERAILTTVKKTGRVIILHDAALTGGVGAEVAACIARHCLDRLDAPIYRCASLDTPIPAAAGLRQNFSASSRFEQQLIELLLY